MFGVFVKGDLDDGCGRVCVNFFRYKYEIEIGWISFVGMEIMGFDSVGSVIIFDILGCKCLSYFYL